MNAENLPPKEYSNADITVAWKSHLCQHSANCVKNLVSVFNPRNRPWINMDGGNTEQIIKAVNTCPSSALSYRKNK